MDSGEAAGQNIPIQIDDAAVTFRESYLSPVFRKFESECKLRLNHHIALKIRTDTSINVDKRKVSVGDIKAFGTYNATVKLFQGVEAEIKVQVTEA